MWRALAFATTCWWCSLVVAGCQSSFEREEFTGTWRLSQESAAFLKQQFAGLKPSFELKRDGTFTAVDFPLRAFFGGNGLQEFVLRGQGTWEVSSHQNRSLLRLNFIELENSHPVPPRDDSGNMFSVSIEIDHSRFDFYLYYFHGDPDEGQMMKFRKDIVLISRKE